MSFIKSVKLWIYSKACMINEGKDPIQYHCLFHNFTTHSFALTGGFSGYSDRFCSSSGGHAESFNTVSINVLLVSRWKARWPLERRHPALRLPSRMKCCILVYVADLTKTMIVGVFQAGIQYRHTWETRINNFSSRATYRKPNTMNNFPVCFQIRVVSVVAGDLPMHYTLL